MPTTRYRRTRSRTTAGLTPALRFFLETGCSSAIAAKRLRIRGPIPACEPREAVWLFDLSRCSPAGRATLRELWSAHAPEILAGWRRRRRRGRPWVEAAVNEKI
jgi:hypothetical protein